MKLTAAIRKAKQLSRDSTDDYYVVFDEAIGGCIVQSDHTIEDEEPDVLWSTNPTDRCFGHGGRANVRHLTQWFGLK